MYLYHVVKFKLICYLVILFRQECSEEGGSLASKQLAQIFTRTRLC